MNKLRILWISVCLIEVTCAQVSPLPEPPQQAAPWSLPEGVAGAHGKIQTTVETLFGLGLADPRGCSYRHVTVREGGKSVEARGWVLPAKPDEPPHAIGWNGLIYPVEKVGDEADLAADVGILKKEGEFEKAPMSNYQEESLERLLAVSAANPRMMRVSAAPYLLLRLGHPVAFVDESPDPFGEISFDFGKGGQLTFPSGLYLDSDYGWLIDYALLIRADGVAAFVDKNDALAAARLPAFDRVWAEVEKRLPHVAGEQQVDPFTDDPSKNFPTRPKLSPSWRLLLADAQRRLEPGGSVVLPELAEEIATWDRLETWDDEAPPATFEKVVAAGPSAIDPLLDCLEHDSRWTRIRQGEENYRGRILRVRDLAIMALERVLRFKVIEAPDEYFPAEDSLYADASSTMRAFCRKYDHACGGELWFRVLADPDADLGLQMTAAESIVRPEGAVDDDPDSFFVPEASERFNAPNPSWEGKLLRGRHDPSVLDLLKKACLRARAQAEDRLAAGNPEVTVSAFVDARPRILRSAANRFVRLMEEWQPGNLDVLKSHYDWLAAAVSKLRTADNPNGFWGAYMISNFCEEALIRRLWSKDETAMQDYEKFFRSSLAFGEVPIQVMKEFPELQGMDQLAKEAFLGDKAPLSFIHKPWSSYDSKEQMIRETFDRSPLLVIPSFRQALIEALNTRTKLGTLLVTRDGATLKYEGGKPENDRNLSKDAALRGTGGAGSTSDVRTCDLVAYFLTPKRGAEVWTSPAFHLDDSAPARDSAIAEWIKVLSAPGPP